MAAAGGGSQRGAGRGEQLGEASWGPSVVIRVGMSLPRRERASEEEPRRAAGAASLPRRNQGLQTRPSTCRAGAPSERQNWPAKIAGHCRSRRGNSVPMPNPYTPSFPAFQKQLHVHPGFSFLHGTFPLRQNNAGTWVGDSQHAQESADRTGLRVEGLRKALVTLRQEIRTRLTPGASPKGGAHIGSQGRRPSLMEGPGLVNEIAAGRPDCTPLTGGAAPLRSLYHRSPQPGPAVPSGDRKEAGPRSAPTGTLIPPGHLPGRLPDKAL